MGVYPAYFILIFVAFYFFLFSYSSSKYIYQYFRKRHHYGRLKSIVNIYRNYLLLGQTLLDKVMVMSNMDNQFTYFMDWEENLLQMENQGSGGILISAHIGNWEIAGHWFSRISQSINIVMLDAEHRQIKEYFDSILQKRSYNIIPIKDDMSHIYQIGAAFQRRELVCMHADRFIEGNKTIKKNFLGEPASFPLGPFIIAATFRVPVTFVFAFKESLTHYHFYSTTPMVFGRDIPREKIIEELMTTFVSKVEELVHKYPRQWFNYYDFWRIS